VIPPAVKNRIPRETFSPQWREIVKGFQKQVEETTFADSTAATLAAFLRGKEDEISRLVKRAEVLAATLQRQSLPFIVCHGDIHAGNIFIDTTQKLYIVDWDTLILAPKERDLMFVGGGQFGSKRTAQAEETLFYRGYGQTEADAVALAYYRYERIVQDIAAYCEQILLNDERDEDRKEGLRQLTSQFLPDGVITAAWESEKRLKNPTR
jgi:spectinomycin phosphotransferase